MDTQSTINKNWFTSLAGVADPSDGLTDLGMKLLSIPEKEAEKRERIEQLNEQIESVESDIEQPQREVSQKSLTFNGWVRVRLKSW